MLDNQLGGDYNIASGKKYFLKDVIKKINIKYKKKLDFIDTKNLSLFGSNLKILTKGFKFKKFQKF